MDNRAWIEIRGPGKTQVDHISPFICGIVDGFRHIGCKSPTLIVQNLQVHKHTFRRNARAAGFTGSEDIILYEFEITRQYIVINNTRQGYMLFDLFGNVS